MRLEVVGMVGNDAGALLVDRSHVRPAARLYRLVPCRLGGA